MIASDATLINVTPSAVRGKFETTRPAVQFQADMLTSGIHDDALMVNCHLSISPRSKSLLGGAPRWSETSA